MDALLIVTGGIAGLLVGLTGVGGGALLTPLLMLFFGITPAIAIGTDLWAASLTKLVASRIHLQQGIIDWQIVKRLWLGSLPASVMTLFWLQGQKVQKMEFLYFFVATVVIFTAICMFFQKKLYSLGHKNQTIAVDKFKALQKPLTIIAGAFLGVIVTITSIGAGAIGAILLTYLYPLRLNISRLIATDILHSVPLAMFAGLGHLLIGNIDFYLLGNLLLGSIPGVLLGVALSARMPYGFLRNLLAIVLLATGVKLWISAVTK